MKIHIPAFEPMAKCNEHLRHGAFDIDLGDDVVRVVRCKDCCHYRKATDWDGNSYYACHKRAAVLIMETKADDFCSYGERRTEC